MRRVAAAGGKIWALGGKNRKLPSTTLVGSHACFTVGRAGHIVFGASVAAFFRKAVFFSLFKLLGDISDLSSVQILTVIAGA